MQIRKKNKKYIARNAASGWHGLDFTPKILIVHVAHKVIYLSFFKNIRAVLRIVINTRHIPFKIRLTELASRIALINKFENTMVGPKFTLVPNRTGR
jgi:hypothetical protein